MNKIIIENLTQLDALVAEQLGYIKYSWEEECYYSTGITTNPETINACIKPEVYNRTEEEWEADYNSSVDNIYYGYYSLKHYIEVNDFYTPPEFSTSYKAMEEIVDYLIENNVSLELYKNKDFSSVTIYTYGPNYEVRSENYKLNSLPLTLCLTFLAYKNIEIELNLK